MDEEHPSAEPPHPDPAPHPDPSSHPDRAPVRAQDRRPDRTPGAEPDVPPVRVLIVDDHPLFREGLKAALESAEGIAVVGEAERVADVPDAVARHRPDLVVMDLSLPDGSGLEATRRLSVEQPAPPVLMLTMADDDGSLLAALQAGARGYLVKGAGREEVLHAVRTVAAGGAEHAR
ncbi:response regulator [Kitasatospora sp. NPDC001574]